MCTAKRTLCVMFIAAFIIIASVHENSQLMPSFFLTSASAQESTPRVIVESCAVEGGGLVSDSICEVRVTLRNTSTSLAVSSVLVTGHWSNENPPPLDFEETNQVYVSDIRPAETRDAMFSLKTQPVSTIALDTIPLYLDIAYSSEQLPDNSNSVILQLPVSKEPPGESEPLEIDTPVAVDGAGGRPDNMQLVYAGGSVFCAFAAGLLIIRRLRLRHL